MSFVQLVATAISVVLAVWAVWKLVLPGAIEALLRERDAQHARDLEKVKTELEAGIRKLQGQIDRTVLVHRVQFETEFAALRDIWRCVVNARNAVNTMRPMFSLVSMDQNDDDKLKELNERLKPLIEAHNALAIAIDASAPFYEKQLYDAFEGIRKVAGLEIIQVQTATKPFDSQWSKDAHKNHEDLKDKMEIASELVRKRLASLAVLEQKNQ